MNSHYTEGFKQEEYRIRFRQALMSLPGGTKWLVHVGQLFGFRERLLGPGIGLPDELRILLYKIKW